MQLFFTSTAAKHRRRVAKFERISDLNASRFREAGFLISSGEGYDCEMKVSVKTPNQDCPGKRSQLMPRWAF